MQELPCLIKITCPKCGRELYNNPSMLRDDFGYACTNCGASRSTSKAAPTYRTRHEQFKVWRKRFTESVPDAGALNKFGIPPYSWDPLYNKLMGIAACVRISEVLKYERDNRTHQTMEICGDHQQLHNSPGDPAVLMFPMETIPGYIEGHVVCHPNGRTMWRYFNRKHRHHPFFIYFKEEGGRTIVFDDFQEERSDIYRHLLLDVYDTIAVASPPPRLKLYHPPKVDFYKVPKRFI